MVWSARGSETDVFFSRSSYKWAHAMVRSRSHKVSVKDSSGKWQEAMALVPVADMFNTGGGGVQGVRGSVC